MSAPSRFYLAHDRAVQAGAGTGKTHALVTQYLHLCAGLTAHGKPIEPRQIAAMTFTDKAAGEMLERLRQRVGRLLRALPLGDEAVAAAEPDLAATSRALGRPLPEVEHWEKVLLQLGSAPVGTFHSFAGALLRRHPALCGVDPDFVLLDEETARDLETESTERVVLLALEGRLPSASAAEAGRLVAEYGFRGAGGGEGLIELLCRVRQKRAEEGLRPEGLAASYSAEEVERGFAAARWQLLSGLRRLEDLADALGDKSAASARDLARAEERLGRALGAVQQVSAVLPECDPMLAALSRLRGKVGDEEGQRALADVKGQIRKAWRDLEAASYTLEAAPLAAAFEGLCAAAWAAYEEAKGRISALDFTDLLYRARDLLRDHAEVRERAQGRLLALLVDEFQDTNPLQAELLLLLGGHPDTRRAGGPGRLFIVGDRKQSIYEFRGADVATFSAMCHAILDAGGDEEALTVSRRSLPGVLALVNALFARVMQPPSGLTSDSSDKTPVSLPSQEGEWPGWIITWDPARDTLLPLRQAEKEEPAAELLCPPAAPGDAQGSSETGAAPPISDDPIGREAELLSRHILALQRGGRRFGEMAVLLWRFTHLSRYLMALRQAQIPYYVVKGRGFYEAQEIRDLCAALTLVDDPEDTLALVSVLRSPLCAVSDDTLVRLHLSGRLRLSALLQPEGLPPDIPAEEADRLRRTAVLWGLLSERGDRLGPQDCLRALCEATDLPAVLAAGPEGEQRVANLELLIARAGRFGALTGGGGLRAFVRWLRLLVEPSLSGESLAPAAQIVDERDDVVRVMTVHQAKGLEFPVVFIPGCAARERADVSAVSYDRDVGIGLTLRRGGERRETLQARRVRDLRRLRAEAESLRLFYVAATRARDRVIFLGEGRRNFMKGTWRGHLEALRATTEGAALTVVHPALSAPGVAGAGGEVDATSLVPIRLPADVAERAAAHAVERAYGLAPRPSASVQMTAAAAADLVVCPRRFHLMHGLRLQEAEEMAARPFASEEDVDREDWLRHGTLAHRLLARADLSGLGADLEALLLADGLDPRHPVIAEIRTRAARLLASRFMREEVAAAPQGAVRRGVRYALSLPQAEGSAAADGGSGRIQLRGQLDLLLEDEGRIRVIDYQYAYQPAAEGPLLALRRGILGFVARRLQQRAGAEAKEVQVGFAYLREADPTPRCQSSEPAAELAAVTAIREAAPLACLGEVPALRRQPLPLTRCAALGCGYRGRCHPASASTAAPDPYQDQDGLHGPR
jgi:ATP-dependent exoDNAse (exonuclease V) beta subunit